MKTLDILKRILVQESTILLNELSDGTKKQMLDKFKVQTDDADEQINDIINSFERIQSSLESNQRDITKYEYKDLKALIEKKQKEKEQKKEKDSIFGYFKKVSSGVTDGTIKLAVNYFHEIKDKLSKNDSDFKNFKNFNSFKEMIENNYLKIISEKISKNIPNVDTNILLASISFFTNNLFSIPLDTKSLLSLKNEREFEYFFDELYEKIGQTKEVNYSNIEKYGGIKKIYDNDNFQVYEPETKEECIRLGSDKANWCVSRAVDQTNLYYAYRFGKMGKEKTMYFVFDLNETEPIDKYFVILVDADNDLYLADQKNQGQFAGGTVTSWNTIVQKIPRIRDLKHLFVWRPFSESEQLIGTKLQNVTPQQVGENPIESFINIATEYGKTPEEITAMWLEIASPTLNDAQYLNLTPDLMKKYLSYAQRVTSNMVSGSPLKVINFYIKKRLEFIKETPISRLNDSDITLLKLPMMKPIRIEKLKEMASVGDKTIDSLTKNEIELLLLPEMSKIKESMREQLFSNMPSLRGTNIGIKYPEHAIFKALKLYPDFNMFDVIPRDIKALSLEGDGSFIIDVPDSISEFTNLQTLTLKNIIKSLPESIGNLNKLFILNINDNKELTDLPETLLKLNQRLTLLADNLPNLNEKGQKIKKELELEL
jgi:hypothetical protein